MEANLLTYRNSLAPRPPSRRGGRLPLRPTFYLNRDPTESFESSPHSPRNVASAVVGYFGLFLQPPRLFSQRRLVFRLQAELFFPLAFFHFLFCLPPPFLGPSPPFLLPPHLCSVARLFSHLALPDFWVLGGCVAGPTTSVFRAACPPQLGVEITSLEFLEIPGAFLDLPAFTRSSSLPYFVEALQLEIESGVRRESPPG